jgi:hypothetical protein
LRRWRVFTLPSSESLSYPFAYLFILPAAEIVQVDAI